MSPLGIFFSRVALGDAPRSMAIWTLTFTALWLSPAGLWLSHTRAQIISPSTVRQWPFKEEMDSFVIQSDFQLPDPENLKAILFQLRNDVEQMFSLPPASGVVHIVLFGTEREYRRYMQYYFPAVEPRRAIFLQDRGPGMLFAYWHEQIRTDLRHEVTHALLNRAGLRPPIWLDEGLAEYFEVASESRFSGSEYLPEIIERAEKGLVPALSQLELIQNMEDFKESHYRDSWAWVHLLLHRRPETRQVLVDYVTELRKHTNLKPLHLRLSHILVDPKREFQDHFLALKEIVNPVMQPSSIDTAVVP
jgi:hypothetical protein